MHERQNSEPKPMNVSWLSSRYHCKSLSYCCSSLILCIAASFDNSKRSFGALGVFLVEFIMLLRSFGALGVFLVEFIMLLIVVMSQSGVSPNATRCRY